jgi:hypothetical protein
MSDECTYLCVMEIEKLINAIESSKLRPADIVRMTDGDIKLSQASAWLLDTSKMSASTKHLLIRLCAEKGLTVPKKLVTAAELESIRKALPKKATGQYGKQKVEFVPATVEMAPSADFVKRLSLPKCTAMGNSNHESAEMKYRILPDGKVKFACNKHWWAIDAGIPEFMAGDRLVKFTELTPLSY